MPRYLTVEKVKDYCKNELPTRDDEFVAAAIDAAEMTLDQACARRFFVADDDASSRDYQVPYTDALHIHDAVEVVSVGTHPTTSYRLEPLNGLTWAGEERPYDTVRLTSGSWLFDRTTEILTVTARWGWSAIPARIEQAALIIAKEILVNRDEVKLGIIGFSDVGGVTARTNPIVRETIAMYKRAEAWGLA